jgi:ATP-dependent DNA helicase RecG
MLSGEVGYYKGTMQLTHPAYLILNSPSGRLGGTKSLKTIAASAGGHGDELDMSVFERDYFPIYPASAKLQSWDIYACVRQVLNVLDPIPESLPEAVVQHWDLVSEDAALRGIHLAEKEADRERARQRLTFDEAVGLQWALVQRRSGDLADSGPPAPRRDDGLAAALGERLPFELTTGQHEVLEVIAAELAATKPMHRLLQGEVGSGKTIVSVLAMLQMVDAGYQCALLAPTEVLAAQHARSVCDVLGPLAMAGQLGGAEHATRVALLTGSVMATLGAALLVVLKRRAVVLAVLIVSVTLAYHS